MLYCGQISTEGLYFRKKIKWVLFGNNYQGVFKIEKAEEFRKIVIEGMITTL